MLNRGAFALRTLETIYLVIFMDQKQIHIYRSGGLSGEIQRDCERSLKALCALVEPQVRGSIGRYIPYSSFICPPADAIGQAR